MHLLQGPLPPPSVIYLFHYEVVMFISGSLKVITLGTFNISDTKGAFYVSFRPLTDPTCMHHIFMRD